MVKIILLLTPVYITLFWAILLNTGARKFTTARLFLGKFMLFAFIIYISHFLFFSPYPDFYSIFDPFYQFASLLVYPLYHIYFRLLTVDEKFSLKIHWPYLLAPTLLFFLYSLGVIFIDHTSFKSWLFGNRVTTTNFWIDYLNVIRVLIRIIFLVQVILTVIWNFKLIQKYGVKAEQYYSDLEDSRTVNVKILNLSMIVTAFTSFIMAALGRNYFSNEIPGIAIASVIFSSMLFLIGWLGDKQKTLNPTYEKNIGDEVMIQSEDLSTVNQRKIMVKILILFNKEKIFMNNKLNIQDIAQAVGTNRTYISIAINQQYNQNFCTFVNDFRVEELEIIIKNNPEFTNQLLSESCGFGSVDSMKRAVLVKTNLSFPKWKNQVLLVYQNK